MTPEERAAAFERLLHPALLVLADQASPAEDVAYARDVLRRVTGLIDQLHSLPGGQRSPQRCAPHVARARARTEPDPAEAIRLRSNADRDAEGLHRIRKGRRQCEATTRDGERCKAPAVRGGSVCRRHGGSATQVKVQAAMMALYEASNHAGEAWEAARGTPGEFDALCTWSHADRAVKEAEAKIDRIAELRAELRRRNQPNPD